MVRLKPGLPFDKGNDIGDWMQKDCIFCVNDKYDDCPIIADLFAGEWPEAITRKGTSVTCSEFEPIDNKE